jgi:hypothetical protein
MTLMIIELYDALIAAGCPDDKARAAAAAYVVNPCCQPPPGAPDLPPTLEESLELLLKGQREIREHIDRLGDRITGEPR